MVSGEYLILNSPIDHITIKQSNTGKSGNQFFRNYYSNRKSFSKRRIFYCQLFDSPFTTAHSQKRPALLQAFYDRLLFV